MINSTLHPLTFIVLYYLHVIAVSCMSHFRDIMSRVLPSMKIAMGALTKAADLCEVQYPTNAETFGVSKTRVLYVPITEHDTFSGVLLPEDCRISINDWWETDCSMQSLRNCISRHQEQSIAKSPKDIFTWCHVTGEILGSLPYASRFTHNLAGKLP